MTPRELLLLLDVRDEHRTSIKNVSGKFDHERAKDFQNYLRDMGISDV